MINNVTLVGRLTRDPELRYTGNGTAVVSFTIAADRPFTNSQGEREADFINCVAWRRTAEVVSNYTHKGSLVGVTGRIQTRSYENNEGRTVYVTEVVVENFRMLESKATAENRRSNDDSISPEIINLRIRIVSVRIISLTMIHSIQVITMILIYQMMIYHFDS